MEISFLIRRPPCCDEECSTAVYPTILAETLCKACGRLPPSSGAGQKSGVAQASSAGEPTSGPSFRWRIAFDVAALVDSSTAWEEYLPAAPFSRLVRQVQAHLQGKGDGGPAKAPLMPPAPAAASSSSGRKPTSVFVMLADKADGDAAEVLRTAVDRTRGNAASSSSSSSSSSSASSVPAWSVVDIQGCCKKHILAKQQSHGELDLFGFGDFGSSSRGSTDSNTGGDRTEAEGEGDGGTGGAGGRTRPAYNVVSNAFTTEFLSQCGIRTAAVPGGYLQSLGLGRLQKERQQQEALIASKRRGSTDDVMSRSPGAASQRSSVTVSSSLSSASSSLASRLSHGSSLPSSQQLAQPAESERDAPGGSVQDLQDGEDSRSEVASSLITSGQAAASAIRLAGKRSSSASSFSSSASAPSSAIKGGTLANKPKKPSQSGLGAGGIPKSASLRALRMQAVLHSTATSSSSSSSSSSSASSAAPGAPVAAVPSEGPLGPNGQRRRSSSSKQPVAQPQQPPQQQPQHDEAEAESVAPEALAGNSETAPLFGASDVSGTPMDASRAVLGRSRSLGFMSPGMSAKKILKKTGLFSLGLASGNGNGNGNGNLPVMNSAVRRDNEIRRLLTLEPGHHDDADADDLERKHSALAERLNGPFGGGSNSLSGLGLLGLFQSPMKLPSTAHTSSSSSRSLSTGARPRRRVSLLDGGSGYSDDVSGSGSARRDHRQQEGEHDDDESNATAAVHDDHGNQHGSETTARNSRANSIVAGAEDTGEGEAAPTAGAALVSTEAQVEASASTLAGSTDNGSAVSAPLTSGRKRKRVQPTLIQAPATAAATDADAPAGPVAGAEDGSAAAAAEPAPAAPADPPAQKRQKRKHSSKASSSATTSAAATTTATQATLLTADGKLYKSTARALRLTADGFLDPLEQQQATRALLDERASFLSNLDSDAVLQASLAADPALVHWWIRRVIAASSKGTGSVAPVAAAAAASSNSVALPFSLSSNISTVDAQSWRSLFEAVLQAANALAEGAQPQSAPSNANDAAGPAAETKDGEKAAPVATGVLGQLLFFTPRRTARNLTAALQNHLPFGSVPRPLGGAGAALFAMRPQQLAPAPPAAPSPSAGDLSLRKRQDSWASSLSLPVRASLIFDRLRRAYWALVDPPSAIKSTGNTGNASSSAASWILNPGAEQNLLSTVVLAVNELPVPRWALNDTLNPLRFVTHEVPAAIALLSAVLVRAPVAPPPPQPQPAPTQGPRTRRQSQPRQGKTPDRAGGAATRATSSSSSSRAQRALLLSPAPQSRLFKSPSSSSGKRASTGSSRAQKMELAAEAAEAARSPLRPADGNASTADADAAYAFAAALKQLASKNETAESSTEVCWWPGCPVDISTPPADDQTLTAKKNAATAPAEQLPMGLRIASLLVRDFLSKVMLLKPAEWDLIPTLASASATSSSAVGPSSSSSSSSPSESEPASSSSTGDAPAAAADPGKLRLSVSEKLALKKKAAKEAKKKAAQDAAKAKGAASVTATSNAAAVPVYARVRSRTLQVALRLLLATATPSAQTKSQTEEHAQDPDVEAFEKAVRAVGNMVDVPQPVATACIPFLSADYKGGLIGQTAATNGTTSASSSSSGASDAVPIGHHARWLYHVAAELFGAAAPRKCALLYDVVPEYPVPAVIQAALGINTASTAPAPSTSAADKPEAPAVTAVSAKPATITASSSMAMGMGMAVGMGMGGNSMHGFSHMGLPSGAVSMAGTANNGFLRGPSTFAGAFEGASQKQPEDAALRRLTSSMPQGLQRGAVQNSTAQNASSSSSSGAVAPMRLAAKQKTAAATAAAAAVKMTIEPVAVVAASVASASTSAAAAPAASVLLKPTVDPDLEARVAEAEEKRRLKMEEKERKRQQTEKEAAAFSAPAPAISGNKRKAPLPVATTEAEVVLSPAMSNHSISPNENVEVAAADASGPNAAAAAGAGQGMPGVSHSPPRVKRSRLAVAPDATTSPLLSSAADNAALPGPGAGSLGKRIVPAGAPSSVPGFMTPPRTQALAGTGVNAGAGNSGKNQVKAAAVKAAMSGMPLLASPVLVPPPAPAAANGSNGKSNKPLQLAPAPMAAAPLAPAAVPPAKPQFGLFLRPPPPPAAPSAPVAAPAKAPLPLVPEPASASAAPAPKQQRPAPPPPGSAMSRQSVATASLITGASSSAASFASLTSSSSSSASMAGSMYGLPVRSTSRFGLAAKAGLPPKAADDPLAALMADKMVQQIDQNGKLVFLKKQPWMAKVKRAPPPPPPLQPPHK